MDNHEDNQSCDERHSELAWVFNRITDVLQQQHKLYQHKMQIQEVKNPMDEQRGVYIREISTLPLPRSFLVTKDQ